MRTVVLFLEAGQDELIEVGYLQRLQQLIADVSRMVRQPCAEKRVRRALRALPEAWYDRTQKEDDAWLISAVFSAWNKGKLAYGHLEQLCRLKGKDIMEFHKSLFECCSLHL